jgi:hypothetical protein
MFRVGSFKETGDPGQTFPPPAVGAANDGLLSGS